MENYPKIKHVDPMAEKKLLVTFSNNTKKIYDCSLLIEEETFKPLLNDAIFRSVTHIPHLGDDVLRITKYAIKSRC
ncbi:MAG: hypothetical protein ACNY01_05260 [Desulfobacteria bacterium]